MKKITENALLFRVNQLKEKMAMIEGRATGAQAAEQQPPATQQTTLQAYNANLAAGMDKNAAWTAAQTGAAKPVTSTTPVTSGSGIPGGVVDQAVSGQQAPSTATYKPAPIENYGKSTTPTPGIPPLSTLANPENKGSGPRAAPGAAAPGGAAPKPSAPAQAKWPETPEEIKAFQQAHKGLDGQPLKVDGLIGPQTMQSLAKSGYKQPPAGFKMANSKQPTAPASGAAAKPATPGQASQGKVSDPKVVELQKKLIAQGWPLKPDGIMGPNTEQAYQAQFKTDSMNASMQPAATPAAPAAALAAAPAGAAAITPAFQSQQAPTPAPTAQQSAYSSSALGQMQRALQQQEAGQSIQTAPPEKPEGVTVFPGTVTQQTAASAAQPSGGWDQNDPNTPAMFRNPLPGEPGMHESVSFKNEDSLARIVQLAKW
jgi:hypothetical protein